MGEKLARPGYRVETASRTAASGLQTIAPPTGTCTRAGRLEGAFTRQTVKAKGTMQHAFFDGRSRERRRHDGTSVSNNKAPTTTPNFSPPAAPLKMSPLQKTHQKVLVGRLHNRVHAPLRARPRDLVRHFAQLQPVGVVDDVRHAPRGAELGDGNDVVRRARREAARGGEHGEDARRPPDRVDGGGDRGDVRHEGVALEAELHDDGDEARGADAFEARLLVDAGPDHEEWRHGRRGWRR